MQDNDVSNHRLSPPVKMIVAWKWVTHEIEEQI